MTEKLEQLIKEHMVSLPKESQEAINNSGWVKTCEEIGKKHLLGDQEINLLQAKVGIVLTGLEEQDYLVLGIEDDVGTSKTEAEKMAEEVVQKILKPIVESLEKKIKESMPNRVVKWQQNLDFILSGGDYTAFIREPAEPEIKDELPKPENTFNPSKIDDLKSRFTI
jgi:hypothetical protein